MTCRERTALVGLITSSALLCPTAATHAHAQPLTIASYQKVSEARITRSITEFTYRADLTNSGPAISGAVATVASLSPATTVVEGRVTFGALASGTTASSVDTFTFRHDRSVPFDFSVLRWTVIADEVNQPPAADAGPDQTAPPGALVQLDGSGSSDPDGDALTFAWSLASAPQGSAVVLSDPTAVNPTFAIDVPGTYVVNLTVNDGSADSAPDTVVIGTDNSAPVANAGPDRTVSVSEIVTLDGSVSSDADGDPLTFTWSFQSRPAASTAVLSDPSAVSPTFVADFPGTYVVQLIVNDGQTDSTPDSVVISTENSTPVADAGLDQSVPAGGAVGLDGSSSHDPDGTPLTFSWSLTSIPAGSAAALSNPAAAAPSFVADLSGTYVAQLIVSDGLLDSVPDTVAITAGTPEVTLEGTDPNGSESGPDPAAFTFTRTGSTASALTVEYSVAGSAINGTDYNLIESSITIPAGSASADLVVLPVDDAAFELPESVHITLVPGAAYTIGTPTPVVITIQDNDAIVNISVSDGTASETGADPGVFTISRMGPTTSALTVFYTASGSATHGADYSALSGHVTIPAGSTSATITILPIDDTLFEGPESVTLNLAADPDYTIGLDQATVTIVDDELPAVTVVANGNAAEAGTIAATFTVARTGPTTSPLTVFYSISGAATNGVDYELLPGSVTIPAGSATATVAITPFDDDLFEDPELVVLSLSGRPDYVVVIPGLAGLTIVDDDGAVVTIVASDPEASEAGGDTGTFTITRAGGDLTAPLIVLISRSGTATNGSDYAAIGGGTFALTIPGNQTSALVTITPLPDTVVEGDETVILTISPRVVYVIGQPGSATVTIRDQ